MCHESAFSSASHQFLFVVVIAEAVKDVAVAVEDVAVAVEAAVVVTEEIIVVRWRT